MPTPPRPAGSARRGDACARRGGPAWSTRRRWAGPVAQWSERAAHNGLVGGSSPYGPTAAAALSTLRPQDSAGGAPLLGVAEPRTPDQRPARPRRPPQAG